MELTRLDFSPTSSRLGDIALRASIPMKANAIPSTRYIGTLALLAGHRSLIAFGASLAARPTAVLSLDGIWFGRLNLTRYMIAIYDQEIAFSVLHQSLLDV